MTRPPAPGNDNRRARVPAALRRRNGQLPRLADLPIPRDVRPGPGWTGQMLEMAAHIGPYATLRLVAAHGGEQVHVPRDPAASPFLDCVDADTAATIAWVYGGTGNRLDVPVARAAVDRARRAVVLAAVRAGKISGADAARIIGTSRTYLAHLVNATDEGRDASSRSRARDLPAQPDLFAALPPPAGD